MATHRLSRLHKHILRWLVADQQRTKGMIASSHADLVKALPAAKGNISRSLRTLEEQGWIVIDRTRGGKAESLHLTPIGRQRASESTRKL
jgi:DNA-binding MarR family transcriptional regulator